MKITVEKNGNFTAPSLRLLLAVLVLVLAGCAASGDSAPQTPDQAAIREEQRAAANQRGPGEFREEDFPELTS